ncbi:hypothetical protein ACFUC1_10115 [Pedococcus sp. NPDC057267]|uniref:hypothetical protein n=1 Tax=Pedococcus sp. NPDC057267 TaxID=3346077 RepID=UPI0036395FE1
MSATASTPSTTTSTPGAVPHRTVPPLGGFNATLLRLEVRRMLRNRRTVVFSVVMPVLFFLIFGTGKSYSNQNAGHGNVAAFVMLSMALYGAMLSTTGGGWWPSSAARAGAASYGSRR